VRSWQRPIRDCGPPSSSQLRRGVGVGLLLCSVGVITEAGGSISKPEVSDWSSDRRLGGAMAVDWGSNR